MNPEPQSARRGRRFDDNLSLRLDRASRARLAAIAERNQTSVASVARVAVLAYLAARGPEHDEARGANPGLVQPVAMGATHESYPATQQ